MIDDFQIKEFFLKRFFVEKVKARHHRRSSSCILCMMEHDSFILAMSQCAKITLKSLIWQCDRNKQHLQKKCVFAPKSCVSFIKWNWLLWCNFSPIYKMNYYIRWKDNFHFAVPKNVQNATLRCKNTSFVDIARFACKHFWASEHYI